MNNEIEDKLKHRNIKPTSMRYLVLKALIEQKTAISISELENQFNKVDKVTLYRTIKTFEENKLIHSIDDGSGAIKYALCTDSCTCSIDDTHIHFVCTVCKHTFCIDNVALPEIILPSNFIPDNIKMVIKGICANCKK